MNLKDEINGLAQVREMTSTMGSHITAEQHDFIRRQVTAAEVALERAEREIERLKLENAGLKKVAA